MSDNIKIEGPVDIKDNSSERVAYDLMKEIANNEGGYGASDDRLNSNPRHYYLNLYSQCLKVVRGHSVPQPDDLLK